MARTQTKQIKIGNITIGGQNKVLIQSMCNIKTSNKEEVIKQINDCASLGADIMRVSVLDEKDADAIKDIIPFISIPLVADIHYDHKLALKCIENGISAIRINPGNIGKEENIVQLINKCKEKHIPIRIGVNSGSFDEDIHNYKEKYNGEKLFLSAKKHVEILEKHGFYDIVISMKGSSTKETIEAYRLGAKYFKYPLHLGITEAGPKDISLIRSAATLSPLLLEGIGDTIRISISGDIKEEIKASKRLLHDLGLYPNYPTIISCPTCGRTEVDVSLLANKIKDYLENVSKPIKVAIMGCVVNGIGENKNADIGVAGSKDHYVIFKKGEVIKKAKEDEIFDLLIEEINKLI